jgi:oligoendopeptidase F
VPILLQLSQADPDTSVRRKAAYALSSAVRNYQPALDQLHKHLPVHIATADEKLDASDMERINEIITKLKES